MNVLTFLIYGIPWWLQVAIVAALVAGLFLGAVRVFGWEKVRPWVLPALALLAAFGLLRKTRQEGYTDRVEQEEVAVDKAVDDFQEIHRKNEGLTEDELDRKNDPWIKP